MAWGNADLKTFVAAECYKGVYRRQGESRLCAPVRDDGGTSDPANRTRGSRGRMIWELTRYAS